MTRSFGLDAKTALRELANSHALYKEDAFNRELARTCAGYAWRPCDLLFREIGKTSKFKNVAEFRKYSIENCVEISYMRDICNESKHGVIGTRKGSKSTIKQAEFRNGDFAREDFDRNDFSVPALVVSLSDGREIDFEDALDIVVKYWLDFANDTLGSISPLASNVQFI